MALQAAGMKEIRVRVKPGAKAGSVHLDDDVLIVAVREPAREGKANEAVRRAVAAWAGVAPSRVSLLRGAKSREKTFTID